MPIYEYECDACGHRFERLVRPPSDTAAPACASCGAPGVRQLLSVFAVDSPATRKQHREHGRRMAQKELRDQKRAEVEALHQHYGEHQH